MGFSSGARRGELQKLKWQDVSFTNSQAFCHDTKNGDDKILHLTPAVTTELQKFREIGNGYIFIGQKGAIHDYRVDWRKAMILAEIPEYDDRYGEKLVFHSERHTFCTDLHAAGVDIKAIQSLAGHKSITTTARYTHTDENTRAATVADVFGSLGVVL